MDQQSVRVDRIGREGQPVVVIDNFSPDPELLIQDAQALTFARMGEFYPGVRAPVTPTYFRGVDDLLGRTMREVFGARERVTFNRALYSLTTLPPEGLGLAQRIPHVDGVDDGMIAIIHYLSKADMGGTAFFRHRTTGFETVNAANHRQYLDALRDDFRAGGEPPARYIDGDTDLFEMTAAYDGVFNRALIYRSSLLHCARLTDAAALSPDPATGRLTVASFLSIA